MLNWLHTLSNLQIGLFLLSTGLCITTLIPALLRWRFKLEPTEPVAKGVEESFRIFTTINLLLLAFCLVRVQGDHRSAEDLAAREGTLMIKASKAMVTMGTDEATKLRELLKSYASSVDTVEWPLLAEQQRSPETETQLRSLLLASKQLQGVTQAQELARVEINSTIVQLSDLREARISVSKLRLPAFLWAAVSSSLIFLMFFGWFQAPLLKMLYWVGGVTAGVALLMTLLISLESPFNGENRVSSEPIRNAIDLM